MGAGRWKLISSDYLLLDLIIYILVDLNEKGNHLISTAIASLFQLPSSFLFTNKLLIHHLIEQLLFSGTGNRKLRFIDEQTAA